MKNTELANIKNELKNLKANASSILEDCSKYPETIHFLHRELQNLLQLQERDPRALSADPAIKQCVDTFVAASAQLSRQVEKMHVEGILKSKKNILKIRKDIQNLSSEDGHDKSLDVTIELQEYENTLNNLSKEMTRFDTYLQYHSRALKALKFE